MYWEEDKPWCRLCCQMKWTEERDQNWHCTYWHLVTTIITGKVCISTESSLVAILSCCSTMREQLSVREVPFFCVCNSRQCQCTKAACVHHHNYHRRRQLQHQWQLNLSITTVWSLLNTPPSLAHAHSLLALSSCNDFAKDDTLLLLLLP